MANSLRGEVLKLYKNKYIIFLFEAAVSWTRLSKRSRLF
ncbi:ETFRF1 isoform 6 [Pan troglodytes]|nr:ETFRF1 isoform 6 [Pan troglodytes]PNJ03841.1 ETFRF1 isoform 6 [Pongo abelii]